MPLPRQILRLYAGRVRLRLTFAVATVAATCLLALPTQAGAIIKLKSVAPLATGFVQDQWPQAPWWDPEMRALGGSYVRYELSWAAAEPRQPAAGSDAGNPANPAFEWQQYIDAEIRNAAAAGLKVILVIDQAPRWAQAPGQPAGVLGGTWRPNAAAFGQFARAVARRYSGSYPDPLRPGARLPAVRYFEAWNEPNESSQLMPQWVSSGGHIFAASPGIYRAMLNSFYSGVKSVSASNHVISAGLAPYGDPPGGRRMQPMAFLRSLLCLNTSLRSACGNVTDLDLQDIHPYSPKDPHWHALNADDVAIPDVYKLNRALASAVRLHHVAPARSKSVIVTEFSWDTNPPDPSGINLATQAKWLEDGLYTLWRQGVHLALWWRFTDQDPGHLGYPGTYQSGILFEHGQPKPSATAFRFPFVAHRLSFSKVRVWGKLPDRGPLKLQEYTGTRWKTMHKYRVPRNGVFQTTVKLRGSALLRAVAGSRVSLTWSISY